MADDEVLRELVSRVLLDDDEAARELVRRGLDAFSLDAYRVGEGVAWRRLMERPRPRKQDTSLYTTVALCMPAKSKRTVFLPIAE